MKRRTILCVDQNEYALPPEQCQDQARPNDFEPCSAVLPTCSDDDELMTEDIELIDNDIPEEIF